MQGFQSAGDTLFPEESTHLNTPGLRLVRGGYRELRFATGAELHLLLRSTDDADDGTSLYAMRYSDPEPCVIPLVGRYVSGFEPTRPAALIAYFQDFARQNTLYFADTNCKRYDFQVEQALLPPIMEVPEGFVIRAGTQLLLVNPQTNRRDVLSEDVEQVYRDFFGRRHVVRAAGRLRIFAQDWTLIGTFGDQVRGFGPFGQSLIFEDRTGIHRLDPSSAAPSALEQADIAVGACLLGLRSSSWATYNSPCQGDSKLVAYNERSRDAFPLALAADARFIDLVPAKDSRAEDPRRDPFWFFLLREIDESTGTGTLYVRTPTGVEHRIGGRAVLSNTRVLETPEGTYGYAMVDVAGDLATLVWWNADGVVKELARNVVRDNRRLITDFDGTRGKLGVISGDRVAIVAEDVPRDGFEYEDERDRWTALLHQFDGTYGQLSLMEGGLDAVQSTPLTVPLPAIELEGIAPGIPQYGAAVMTRVLPGIMYFSEYDWELRVGTLHYRNVELRFTALLNYGISDFVVAEDEVIYTIPYGDSAGVWVVQAK